MIDRKLLIKKAFEAQKYSYSPYSNFAVGAALLSDNGDIYQGCNVENASYSLTNCAERTALFSAIANGEKEFDSILIIGGKNGDLNDYAMPCGACRQALSEFCDNDFKVYVAKNENDIKEFLLKELLPFTFDKDKLGE